MTSRWLGIEINRGDGWELAAEGEAPEDVELWEITATLRDYAAGGEARAILDGAVIASTAPSAIL
jgi:hypothetical protein